MEEKELDHCRGGPIVTQQGSVDALSVDPQLQHLKLEIDRVFEAQADEAVGEAVSMAPGAGSSTNTSCCTPRGDTLYYKGIITQLEAMGFSTDDATAAAARHLTALALTRRSPGSPPQQASKSDEDAAASERLHAIKDEDDPVLQAYRQQLAKLSPEGSRGSGSYSHGSGSSTPGRPAAAAAASLSRSASNSCFCPESSSLSSTAASSSSCSWSRSLTTERVVYLQQPQAERRG